MSAKSAAALFAVLVLTVIVPLRSGRAVESAGSPAMLKTYVAELKRTPEDSDLRRTIIKLAQSLKPRPPVPEEAERALARGSAYLKTAADAAGYRKAIDELQAAISAAPWVAEGYLNLGTAQEKAGLYAEAIQNLKFYQLAAPQAKNSREVKNKIYELEVFAEEAKKGQKQPQAAPAPQAPAVTAAPAPQTAAKTQPPAQVTAKPAAPPAQASTAKPQGFVGSWYIRDTGPRGDEITIHVFTLSKDAKGDLLATAPKRTANSIGTVAALEVSGKKIKVVLIWELSDTPGYWKTEFFDLTLSGDESKLSGMYFQQSSKYREDVTQDVVLVRQ